MSRGPNVPTRLAPGCAYPLGATWDGGGVNFAVFSAHAERIQLCLYDAGGLHETRLDLPERTDEIWHGYLPGAAPGLLYGFRAHGPYEPARGHRFNAYKLLLDPYARATGGEYRPGDIHKGYRAGLPHGDSAPDERDNAAATLKGRVVDPACDWGDDHPPRTSWADTVIYEVHVKGFSMTNPDIPAPLRGCYAGIASDPAIAYLQRLGVTAVELMPVQEFIDEPALVRHGLSNYWGYNPIAYFTPAARYASGSDPTAEFRSMVRRLHAAGIEVILDVVYNHTGETDQEGPTLSFRGLDNASYYRLRRGDRRHYENISGCGNTLNLSHPRVLQMTMDSLRWWVEGMHVDGFRFDLATALARSHHAFDPDAAFLQALRQDPVLGQVKLIAEPWDCTGHHTGQFPPGFAEWNDFFRDAMRRFWLTGEAGCGELARRIAGSDDRFHHSGRAPQASINFVAAHDGFTLADVVSYQRRHNEENPHANTDGSSHNHSINCGVEGPCADPSVRTCRDGRVRALLATLALSCGVPMLLAGDELGRTQRGNNNAYCQDNALSWLDWPAAREDLIDFTRRLFALRRSRSLLRRTRWLDGSRTPFGERDVTWIWTDGLEMTRERWEDSRNRCLGILFGRATLEDETLLVLINGADREAEFALPPPGHWVLLIDTAEPLAAEGTVHDRPGKVAPHALRVLAAPRPRAHATSGTPPV